MTRRNTPRSMHAMSAMYALVVCMLGCMVSPCQGVGQDPAVGTPPRLRAPWTDRAVDYGVVADTGIHVFSDAGRPSTLALLEHLARVRGVFFDVLGRFPLRTPDAPRLLVFDDLAELRFTVRTAFAADRPEVSATFVDHPEGGVLAVTPQGSSRRGLERTLQAEAFRQYAGPRFGTTLPPWAVVGLSEYFGEMLLGAQGAWSSGHVPADLFEQLKRAMAADRILPLERLIRLDPVRWKRFEATHGTELLHAESWALVQFFLHGDGGRFAGAFKTWLDRVAVGSDPVKTFEEVFQGRDSTVPLADLEAAWRAYIRALEPSPVLVGLDRIELLQLALEELEGEGVRPTGPDALVEAISVRLPIKQVVFSHPYERVNSMRTSGLLEPGTMKFLPARVQPSGGARSETPPPMGIELTETGDWVMQLRWRLDEETGRWIPWVWRERRGK